MFTRYRNNPIIRSSKNSAWQSRKVYNPTAIYDNDSYHLLYRAIGRDWTSRIGLAKSKRGLNFESRNHPALIPETKDEIKGVEDPRLTKIEKTYYLTYTAYDGKAARIKLATSQDLKTWKKHGRAIPNWDLKKAKGFNVPWDKARNNPIARKVWHKAGAIFPEKIKGKYWMIFGDSNLWLATSKDGLKWKPTWKPFIEPRPDHFDSVHVEMGPAPIKTDKGWLIIYHGINNRIVYRLGIILLDQNNPRKILYRSTRPVFEPYYHYELNDLTDIMPGGFSKMRKLTDHDKKKYKKLTDEQIRTLNVVFCCGAVLKDKLLRIYYGASDSVICTATAKLKDILPKNI